MSSWDQRIQRAEELAQTHPFASELLRFYVEITRFQRAFYDQLKAARGSDSRTRQSVPLLLDGDVPRLAAGLPPLLALVRRAAPTALAEYARTLEQDGPHWEAWLVARWNSDGCKADERDAFFLRALLQPYAEYHATHCDIAPDITRPNCPFCRQAPQVAVLRGQGDGARRSLVCSLCSTEWNYRRLICPGCGEEAADKLPVYTTAQFDYLRVEACDTCQRYIKTVDLTKNGLAVPVVDELATTPLNLWARERGYTKLQPNLLGL